MAAGATYTPIATTTLGSAQASYTFSSIPSTYTDLILVLNASSVATADIMVQLNSDTGSNYSRTKLTGNGTAASSSRTANADRLYLNTTSNTTTTAGEYNSITSFNNYSNTTTYKTTLTRANAASLGTDALVQLWRSTAAISTIYVYSTGTFSAGSTFTLYGIASA